MWLNATCSPPKVCVAEQYSSTIPASFDLLDTNTKIKILVECFDNECVIEKSKTYNSSIEGSFTPNFYQDPNKIK